MDRAIPGQGSRSTIFNRRMLWGLLAGGALAWSLSQIGWGSALLNPGGWPLAAHFWQASLQPDLSPEFLAVAGRALLVTLAYAVSSTALSVLLGLAGGLFASQVWWQVWGDKPAFRLLWLGTRAFLGCAAGRPRDHLGAVFCQYPRPGTAHGDPGDCHPYWGHLLQGFL